MTRFLRRGKDQAADASALILRAGLAATLARLSLASDPASASIAIASTALAVLVGLGLLTRTSTLAGGALVVLHGGASVASLPIAAVALALSLSGGGTRSLDHAFRHRRTYEWSERA